MAAQSTSNPSRRQELPGQGQSLSTRPAEDVIEYLKEYARQKPDAAALWCFGVGFVLGWKLKPW